jgi:hypothetical protein
VARQRKASKQARQGKAWLGNARYGKARQGKATQGKERLGMKVEDKPGSLQGKTMRGKEGQ